jgi:cytochrome oxidase Cu insertion factor (SCO1/SenC/PrrC family)
MPMFTRRVLLSCWGAFTIAALVACSPDKPSFKAIDITGADYARGFTLSDHNGQTRSLSDFKGKVVVVFFGYTQCPDVCPTSMTCKACSSRWIPHAIRLSYSRLI